MFLTPRQRLEMEFRRKEALVRKSQSAQLANCSDLSQEVQIRLAHRKQHEANAQWLLQESKRVKKWSATIGTGCDCGKTKRNPELEFLLTPYVLDSIASLVVEYIPPNTTPHRVLSKQQRYVIETIAKGNNVFYTGFAGTGKSFILQSLRKLPLDENAIAWTAMTGTAALEIGGRTLHSFAGIGQGGGKVNDLIEKIRMNRFTVQRWRRCEVLIIDEISMLSCELFETLEAIARAIRPSKQHMPFGGIMLIGVGDFFQLAPIQGKYAFESPLWRHVFAPENCIELRTIFRQKDQVFTQMLNEVRRGSTHLTAATCQMLVDLSRPLCQCDGILPTTLKCKNEDVSRINNEQLAKLNEPIHTFSCHDSFTTSPADLERLKKNCNAEEELKLCKGAQVMHLRNTTTDDNIELRNGSRGVVVNFDSTGFPIVYFQTAKASVRITRSSWKLPGKKDEILATRSQLPLKLAWATTIHKIQGATVDRVSVDLTGVFEYGQAYVALSRAQSLRNMQVIGFQKHLIKTKDICNEFAQTLFHVYENDNTQQREPFEAVGVWNCRAMYQLLETGEYVEQEEGRAYEREETEEEVRRRRKRHKNAKHG